MLKRFTKLVNLQTRGLAGSRLDHELERIRQVLVPRVTLIDRDPSTVQPPTQTYTSIIDHLMSRGYVTAAEEVVDHMKKVGLTPTQSIHRVRIEGLARMDQGEKARALAMHEIHVPWMDEALIRGLCQGGHYHEALDRLNQTRFPTRAMYHAFLRYGTGGHPPTQILASMMARGLQPNYTTYRYLLRTAGMSEGGDLDSRIILAFMTQNLETTTQFNRVLTVVANPKQAELVLSLMRNRTLVECSDDPGIQLVPPTKSSPDPPGPNAETYARVIEQHLRTLRQGLDEYFWSWKRVLELVEAAEQPIGLYNRIIEAFMLRGFYDDVEELVWRLGDRLDAASYHLLVIGYTRIGWLEKAQAAFDQALNRAELEQRPDVEMRRALIEAYVWNGDLKAARSSYLLQPDDPETHHRLIEALVQTGRLTAAMDQLNHRNLHPISYYTVIEGWIKRNRFDEVERVLHRMKIRGVKIDLSLFSALCGRI